MEQALEYERIWKDWIQGTDLINLLSPNEVFENIQPYDSTVEVIGIMEDIELPRSVGSTPTRRHDLLKFYLNNKKGKRIPVLAWNYNISRELLKKIRKNTIVHLDGVQVTIPELPTYNDGNVPYQLIIRENTVVTNLSDYKSISVKLNEVLDTSGPIVLEGYVKSNFMEREYPNDECNTFGCGSITDGTYKLEIHIKNFSRTDYLELGIGKGDKISVIGTIKRDNYFIHNPIYLDVKDIRSIRKLQGHMPFSEMLKGHLCV
ncbi:uncharacterized protein LOC105832794 [Monomorium pharaonis]|uniref:uncharacterized protein LOC105832794 n=1 Tax=Monomorium pharaonis TaxID=307658 RepID=UPI00063FC42F|nr:uncharacterized protein LOC105832794 [Monomorium pharaonis]XP_036138394.1 uncharacterized protein LOC105832794 [Monomorium pharaonis]XP_036138395.1 uncharacterized protein LOC105832794 [Monomorium pharaonis]XP_036138396.1 uncharacterized protein LOC105832794 [Monomorium pharaonis]XP_036138397.1 uncharacterized protein LOC105832794 [Monomorium pharaonis]